MFKGQPKGLYALALANTGERFGYYTMLAVFALFLRANFGLEAGVAGAILQYVPRPRLFHAARRRCSGRQVRLRKDGDHRYYRDVCRLSVALASAWQRHAGDDRHVGSLDFHQCRHRGFSRATCK